MNQKSILSNASWLMTAYVYRFAIGMVALAFVTRYLGPEKYGTYSYALSFFSFIELFLSVINQEIFKKEVLESKQPRQLINSYFIFCLAFSSALIGFTLSILWFFDLEIGERRVLISILSLSLLFRAADCLSYFLNVKMRNDLISKVELTSTTLFNFSRIGLVWGKIALAYFAALVVLQKFVNFILTTYYYKRVSSYPILISDYKPTFVKTLIRKSLPLFLSSASVIIFTRIDQLMIGNLMSDRDVGLYSIVVKLTESWAFVATILTQAIYPSLVKVSSSDRSDFNHKVAKTLCLLFYASLAIMVGTWLFSETLIHLISSAEYLAASPVLKIHIISVLFVFWQNLGNQYDIIVDAAQFTLVKTVLASITNVGLNFILIPHYGILGASLATIVSYGSAACFFNVFYSKTRPYFVLQLRSFMFWQNKWLS